jgi:transcriptional regulator with XRE-family HTH domain
VAFDYGKLLGRIREQGKTQVDLAKWLGISRTSVNLKLNNRAEFSSHEIVSACEFLDIPKDAIPDYFFTAKVQKHEQTNF